MNIVTDEALKKKYNKLYKKFIKGDFLEVIKECNKKSISIDAVEPATEIVSARNGRIFVGACTTGNMNKRDTDRSSSTLSRSEREQICRVSNIVRMFSLLSLPICPYRILEVSKKSVQWGFVPRDILTPSFQKLVEANYIEIS